MEDCASSSSSASSSSTAVDENEILAPSYFPCNLKMKSMRLFVRNLSYSGHVNLVDEREPLWCTCHFKMARPSRDRFAIVGDLAKLETDGRRFCTGDITAIDHDAAGLSTVLQIRVPSARGKIVLKSAHQVLVMIKPVIETRKSLLPEQDKDKPPVKICIKGFGKLERILIQMALQSIDVHLVAIYEPLLSLDRMIKVWENTKLSIALKNDQTLVFEKRYYKKGKETNIKVLLEQIEVIVFREENEINRSNADFLIELQNFSKKEDQSPEMNQNLSSCLRNLPEEVCAYGLYVDAPHIIAHLNRDKQNTTRRAASIAILLSSTAAVKAVRTAFSEWDEKPTSLQFLANPLVDRSIAIDISSLDLKVKLEKAQIFRGTDDTGSRFCDGDNEKLQIRVDAILSWCLDVVRCVPVEGCRLEII